MKYPLFFFLCAFFNAQSQDWNNFNPANSPLPENGAHVVADKNGVIWISSSHSISSYDDGTWSVYDFDVMGLSFRDVRSTLAIDTANHIWFAADSFLVEFDGAVFTTHDTVGFGGGVSSIAVNRKTNELWIASDIGLFNYNGTGFTRYTSSNSGLLSDFLFQVNVDTAGYVWMLQAAPFPSPTVQRFDGDTAWTSYPLVQHDSSFYGPYAIAGDDFGNEWMGYVHFIGIRKFENGDTVSFPNVAGVICAAKIGVDRNGNPWLYNSASYLLVDYYDGTNWIYEDGGLHGMPSLCSSINSFAFDDFGNTWMGTSYGVVVFNPNGLSLGVINNSVTYDLDVYPSVTDGKLFLNLENYFRNAVARVYDMTGRLLIEKSIDKDESKYSFDLSALQSGTYIIQLVTAGDFKVFVSRFIKL